MKSRGPFFSIYFWTTLAFLFGVMPLWLSSTEMWDGVVGIQALTSRDWLTIKGWLLNSNWYLTYALFRITDALQQITGLPHWIFFKLWITLMIVGIACEVYRLAQAVFEIPASIAKWLPALIFSFPLWYVFFSYTPMLGHLTCVWLALAGYRLLYSNKKWPIAIGVVFVLMSFQLASNCAFILTLELGRWLLCKDKAKWRYWRSASLLLLALGVFAATRVVWPPVGTYVGYNRFLNPLHLSSWISYAKYSALFATWLVLVFPMGIGIWWAARPDHAAPALRQELQRRWKMLAILALITFATCLPYIAVGLGSPLFTLNIASSNSISAVLASNSALGPVSVWYGGWGARHMLLMMIPMVLLAACLATCYQNLDPVDSPVLCKTLVGTFISMVCLNLAFGVPGHWSKLQRIAAEQAVVQLLASHPPMPYGPVDILLDKRVDYLGSMYETNYLLSRAYKGTHWAALMLPDHPALQKWGEEYRRFVADHARVDRALIAKLNMMDDYSWAVNCDTVVRITLPELSAWDVLWRAEHSPEHLTPAQITPVSSSCSEANEFWR